MNARVWGFWRVPLSLWWLGLLVMPIYVFGLGAPQPGSIILAGMLVLLATGAFLSLQIPDPLAFRTLIWFTLLTSINLIWFSKYPDPRFLLTIAYYALNLSLMIAVAALLWACPTKFIRYTQTALLLSLVLELALVLVLSSGQVRAVGTFNNPNQLGYWALLVAVLWFTLRPKGDRLRLPDLAVLALSILLCLASASRGATLAAGLLLFLVIIRHKAVLLLGLVLAAGVLFLTPATLENYQSLERLSSSRPADNLEGRGYDRLWNHPECLAFSCGEGAFYRMPSGVGGHEIHSGPATLLVSYGIVGTTIFLWFLLPALKSPGAVYLLPILLYNLTHNGFRQPLLWIILGVLFGLAYVAWYSKPKPVAVFSRQVEPSL